MREKFAPMGRWRNTQARQRQLGIDTFQALAMAKFKKNAAKKAISFSYRYGDKRKNNPHVDVVDTTSDGMEGHTTWTYGPHIDPALNLSSVQAGIENLRGIKAELNAALLVQFQSLSFNPGDDQCIVMKVVDDREIESP